MVEVIHAMDLPAASGRTVRFDGCDHGSGVSFFLVDNAPGQGPGLHVHAYSETWIVRSGKVEFTVGPDKVRAGPGAIVVGPAGIPHKFLNVGPGRLELVCIHASDRIVQEWLEEPSEGA